MMLCAQVACHISLLRLLASAGGRTLVSWRGIHARSKSSGRPAAHCERALLANAAATNEPSNSVGLMCRGCAHPHKALPAVMGVQRCCVHCACGATCLSDWVLVKFTPWRPPHWCMWLLCAPSRPWGTSTSSTHPSTIQNCNAHNGQKYPVSTIVQFAQECQRQLRRPMS